MGLDFCSCRNISEKQLHCTTTYIHTRKTTVLPAICLLSYYKVADTHKSSSHVIIHKTNDVLLFFLFYVSICRQVESRCRFNFAKPPRRCTANLSKCPVQTIQLNENLISSAPFVELHDLILLWMNHRNTWHIMPEFQLLRGPRCAPTLGTLFWGLTSKWIWPGLALSIAHACIQCTFVCIGFLHNLLVLEYWIY